MCAEMKGAEGNGRKRIVLIGPVYPYKGGIAHYTCLMYRTLVKAYDVTMVSYRLQYPKLLYRGEQKDYGDDGFRVEGTEFLLNTANPANWLFVARRIRSLSPDAVIIQWWHPYFAPCYRVLAAGLGRKIPVLFVCHNVFPHERFPFDRFLTRFALKGGDCFIVQSKTDAEDLVGVLPEARFRQAVHPTYNAFRLEGLTKAEARERLGIPSSRKVLLFFGFVREYKGLKYLIEALPGICKTHPDILLLVVGDFAGRGDKAFYTELIESNGVSDVVEIHDGYVPDREVEKYFAACDLVVCPYVSATQSGVVQIAFGFGKPVVATSVGGLPDVVTDGETGYVVEPGRPDLLTEAVCDFFGQGRAEGMENNVRREAWRFDWERMREQIEVLLGWGSGSSTC